MNAYQTGMKGETEAAAYLKEKGYSLICRNFRGRRGEIDAVGILDTTLVFFEMKTLNTIDFDTLEYLVDRKKQCRIINASKDFLYQNPEYTENYIRFDVIYINNERDEIRHIENAFVEGGIV